MGCQLGRSTTLSVEMFTTPGMTAAATSAYEVTPEAATRVGAGAAAAADGSTAFTAVVLSPPAAANPSTTPTVNSNSAVTQRMGFFRVAEFMASPSFDRVRGFS